MVTRHHQLLRCVYRLREFTLVDRRLIYSTMVTLKTKQMKITLFLFVWMTMSCTEIIEPEFRAEILSIEEQGGGSCLYTLTGIVPYAAPEFESIVAPCGKYSIGQVIYF